MDVTARIGRYRGGAWAKVPGWVDASAVDALELAARYQAEHRVAGDALEIGVFHGRFFLALLAAIARGEVAIAVDIFDDQMLNVDHSATDSDLAAKFRANLKLHADNPRAVRIVTADSLTLRASDILAQAAHPRCRLISVDGGHTAEHVMNDMGLAADVIATGGVVFLDDWMSPHWPGVHEGYLRFMTGRNRNLAPVLFTGNKLVMTTISHHPTMLAWYRERYVAVGQQEVREVASCGFRFLSAV